MIIERSRQLIKLLDQKRMLNDNLKKVAGFKTRRDEIKNLISRLEPLVKTSSAFRNNGIGQVDVRGQVRAFEEIVLEVISTVKLSPKAILEAKSIIKLKDGGNNFTNDLEVKLKTLWINYTRTLLPDINNDLLDVLDRLPSFSKSVMQIRQISAEIVEFKDNLPLSEKQIDKFNKLADRMKSVWDGIEAVSPDILNFLQNAVSSSGAPIDLLTDEVKEWLDKNKIKTSFKIRLSS